jgi:hypothetical protein
MTALLTPHLLGNHGLVQYAHLKIWAERGLIRIEHTETGQYEILSVADAAKRALAISEMARLRRKNPKWVKYYDEIAAQMDFVDRMHGVLQKAREQGMPTDPTARRDLTRRMPVTVSVPADIYL